jgi:hypothetical protein
LTLAANQRIVPSCEAFPEAPAPPESKAMHSVACSVTALCMLVGLQAPATPKSPKQSDLVTVRGCLHGLTLTTGFEPRQFQLTGSRELSALLKQHSGHVEEITGRLKAGNVAGATVVKEKSGSKGRIYVGAGTGGTGTSASETLTIPVIDVRSVAHIENRCPGA